MIAAPSTMIEKLLVDSELPPTRQAASDAEDSKGRRDAGRNPESSTTPQVQRPSTRFNAYELYFGLSDD
jgi:hypothetical protein